MALVKPEFCDHLHGSSSMRCTKNATRNLKRFAVIFSQQIFLTQPLNSFIHSLVFSFEGRAWQEPEPSHVTGMALAHCILGKFLGIVCHCFYLTFRRSHFSRQIPPSTTKREILAAKGGNVGEKDSDFYVTLGMIYMPQIYDMGPTALLPLRRKAC